MKRTAALLAGIAMIVTACEERDYGDLPKDAAERAQACMRASVLHVGLAEQSGDKARLEAAKGKMAELMKASDFVEHFPDAKEDPNKAFGTDQQIADAAQSNWLSTLNTCLKAYALQPEPEPALPSDPYGRAIMCAAATALDNSRGKAINPNSRVVSDPEGYYFVYKAAKAKGSADAVGPAADAAIEALKTLLNNGAGHLLAGQCRKNDPKAVTGTAAPLPADPLEAGAICSNVLTQLKQGGLAVGAGDTEDGGRFAGAEEKWTGVLNGLSVSDAQIVAARRKGLDYVVSAGRADGIARLCAK